MKQRTAPPGLVEHRRPMSPSYYILQRLTIVDHTGTGVAERFFTTCRARLEREIRAAIERESGFVMDVLRLAWIATLEQEGRNELGEYQPLSLIVAGGAPWRRDLVPDTTIARADEHVVLTVNQEALLAASRRRRSRSLQPMFTVGDETFGSLEAVGEGTFLDRLRQIGGRIDVSFDLSSLLETIPELRPPRLDRPLRFVPFFESEAFRVYWAEEGEFLELEPGRSPGVAWDGVIPLETWFCLEALERICDDIDVVPRIAP